MVRKQNLLSLDPEVEGYITHVTDGYKFFAFKHFLIRTVSVGSAIKLCYSMLSFGDYHSVL